MTVTVGVTSWRTLPGPDRGAYLDLSAGTDAVLLTTITLWYSTSLRDTFVDDIYHPALHIYPEVSLSNQPCFMHF